MKERKFCFVKRVLSLFLAIALIAVPILAQQVESQPYLDGQRAAEQNVGTAIWFVAGLFLSVLGFAMGYLIAPNPPASLLIGKSVEYVMAFTDAYKSKGKSMQGKWALIGCAVNAALWGVLILAVGIWAAEEVDDYYYWYQN